MKMKLLATLVLPFFLAGAGSAASQMMGDGKGAMMHRNMQQQDGLSYGQNPSSRFRSSMTGPCGMMPGMMGGMMNGSGMGQMGMMGSLGMGQSGSSEEMTKFFEQTRELRKKLHDLRFEYGEQTRNPNTTIGELQNMREEMYELHGKIIEKAPQQ